MGVWCPEPSAGRWSLQTEMLQKGQYDGGSAEKGTAASSSPPSRFTRASGLEPGPQPTSARLPVSPSLSASLSARCAFTGTGAFC